MEMVALKTTAEKIALTMTKIAPKIIAVAAVQVVQVIQAAQVVQVAQIVQVAQMVLALSFFVQLVATRRGIVRHRAVIELIWVVIKRRKIRRTTLVVRDKYFITVN